MGRGEDLAAPRPLPLRRSSFWVPSTAASACPPPCRHALLPGRPFCAWTGLGAKLSRLAVLLSQTLVLGLTVATASPLPQHSALPAPVPAAGDAAPASACVWRGPGPCLPPADKAQPPSSPSNPWWDCLPRVPLSPDCLWAERGSPQKALPWSVSDGLSPGLLPAFSEGPSLCHLKEGASLPSSGLGSHAWSGPGTVLVAFGAGCTPGLPILVGPFPRVSFSAVKLMTLVVATAILFPVGAHVGHTWPSLPCPSWLPRAPWPGARWGGHGEQRPGCPLGRPAFRPALGLVARGASPISLSPTHPPPAQGGNFLSCAESS